MLRRCWVRPPGCCRRPDPLVFQVGCTWDPAGRSPQPLPLRLDSRADQADPGGTFRLADTADGDLDVLRDGQPQYRVEARPRTLADFEPTCWWHQTSPRSHVTHGPVCSRLTQTGRVTLSDRTLVQTTADQRQEHTLTSDAEVLAGYRTWFGIVLDRVPGRPAGRPASSCSAPVRPR